LAFQGLYSWDITQCDPSDLFTFTWSREEPAEDIKVFASFVIKGTINNLTEIDSKIKGSLKKWDFGRLEKVNLAILRMSVYALLYQKDIPHGVTIDEAVEITKEYGTPDSYRFVNGVLDNIKKQIEE